MLENEKDGLSFGEPNRGFMWLKITTTAKKIISATN